MHATGSEQNPLAAQVARATTAVNSQVCLDYGSHNICWSHPCAHAKKLKERKETTLLSVIKEKLMVNLSFPLA